MMESRAYVRFSIMKNREIVISVRKATVMINPKNNVYLNVYLNKHGKLKAVFVSKITTIFKVNVKNVNNLNNMIRRSKIVNRNV